MQYSYPLAAVLLSCTLFSACGNRQEQQTAAATAAARQLDPELYTDLYGNYIGDFVQADEQSDVYIEPVRINVMITRITGKGAQGRSIVRGNNRPMSGQVSVAGEKYTFIMDEPGDDAHDGRFSFFIQGDSLVGTWIAYDRTVKGPEKKFVLHKKPFVYNAHLMLPADWDYVDWTSSQHRNEYYQHEDGTVDTMVYEYYRSASDQVYRLNASLQQLTEAQLKNLKKLDLEIIRNTVYARHGYAFKKKAVRQFFDQVDWYIPLSDEVEHLLSPLEKENVALLKRFEQYAADNYDTFGR